MVLILPLEHLSNVWTYLFSSPLLLFSVHLGTVSLFQPGLPKRLFLTMWGKWTFWSTTYVTSFIKTLEWFSFDLIRFKIVNTASRDLSDLPFACSSGSIFHELFLCSSDVAHWSPLSFLSTASSLSSGLLHMLFPPRKGLPLPFLQNSPPSS